MRIGVLATLQHSMFSAGIANTSIAVAELMRELGHTVELIQLAEKQTWWDDCLGLSKHWTVVSINDAKEYDLIFEIDVVCIMSVNPGFGGQKFIPHTYEKVKALKQLIIEHKASTFIEIDGGVTLENAAALVAAGADVLVAGTTVFKATDPIQMIASLRNC